MHSIELAIIIPILVILLVTALMLFQFATELSVFESIHSRQFMLSLSKPSDLNGEASLITVESIPYHVFQTKFIYEANQEGKNAFEILTGKSHYTFRTKFYALKNNRMALALFKTGQSHFFDMDR